MYSINRELWLEEAAERVEELKAIGRAILAHAEDDERVSDEELSTLEDTYYKLWYNGGHIYYTEPDEIAQLEENIEALQAAYEDIIQGR